MYDMFLSLILFTYPFFLIAPNRSKFNSQVWQKSKCALFRVRSPQHHAHRQKDPVFLRTRWTSRLFWLPCPSTEIEMCRSRWERLFMQSVVHVCLRLRRRVVGSRCWENALLQQALPSGCQDHRCPSSSHVWSFGNRLLGPAT